MKEWHFNVLFFVGVGGALVLLFGPSVGLQFDNNPTAVAGVGAILSYVLTQKDKWTKKDKPPTNIFDDDVEFYRQHRREMADKYDIDHVMDILRERLDDDEEER